MKRNALIASVLTIALCLSIAVGATYALFTSKTEASVSITSATVDFKATVVEDSIALYSMDVPQSDSFENGGTAALDGDSKLELVNVTPGDKVTFTIKVYNSSNVTVQYRVKWAIEGELYDALVATADGSAIVNGASGWTTLEAPENEAERTTLITVSVELPKAASNEFQNKTAKIAFFVEAIQGNASDADKTDVFG